MTIKEVENISNDQSRNIHHNISCLISNNSYFAAEQVGYIVKIDRVRKVIEGSCNLPEDFKDGVLTLARNSHEGVLVEGLSVEIEASVISYSKLLLIECTTWCKDSNAIHSKTLLDTENNTSRSFCSRDYISMDDLYKDLMAFGDEIKEGITE